MANKLKILATLLAILCTGTLAWAVDEAPQPASAQNSQQTQVNQPVSAQNSQQTQVNQPASAQNSQQAQAGQLPPVVLDVASSQANSSKFVDPIRYTLGADDVIDIQVMRHPEFSGVFPINMEGKIQLKFVGDIDVTGLTKKEVEDKIKEGLSTYVNDPQVNVTILEYKSKFIYVVGEVSQPGRYYMRVDSLPVREVVVNAGLPTTSASMRKCRLITPTKDGKIKTKFVDLYSLLFYGDLKQNIDMHPGDVLYIPSTIMTKIVRAIYPVSSVVGVAASAPNDAATGRTALKSFTQP